MSAKNKKTEKPRYKYCDLQCLRTNPRPSYQCTVVVTPRAHDLISPEIQPSPLVQPYRAFPYSPYGRGRFIVPGMSLVPPNCNQSRWFRAPRHLHLYLSCGKKEWFYHEIWSCLFFSLSQFSCPSVVRDFFSPHECRHLLSNGPHIFIFIFDTNGSPHFRIWRVIVSAVLDWFCCCSVS